MSRWGVIQTLKEASSEISLRVTVFKILTVMSSLRFVICATLGNDYLLSNVQYLVGHMRVHWSAYDSAASRWIPPAKTLSAHELLPLGLRT